MRKVSIEENRTVAIITVPQGNAKPYMLKHNNREDIYVRYGDICQLADRERQARLFQSGGLISAESFPVYGSSLGELDERRYKEYFLEVLEENTISNWEQILKDRSFLIEDFLLALAMQLFFVSSLVQFPKRRTIHRKTFRRN